MKRFFSLLFMALALASCRSKMEVPLTDHLTLVVKDLSVGESSYKALFAFKERTSYEEIIQEVQIENAAGLYLSLVESFDTTWWDLPSADSDGVQGTVTDQHWTAKVEGWEHRDCKFYAGRVLGADKDSVGFAMLPENMDGSLKTQVSDLVNQSYRARQQIQGRVVARHPETGHYWIDWIPGQLTVSSDLGSIIHENGETRVIPSKRYVAEKKARNRMRSLRMGGRFS